MGAIESVTVNVKANMSVDEKTAEMCLRMVEQYVNQDKGRNIMFTQGEDGWKSLSFYEGSL